MRAAGWLVAVLGLVGMVESGRAVERPDIVVILADDLGWSDLGCYGGEIRTPVLDGLAAGGVRFTQFYNSARCCPTRASLLSGLYPHQAGVGSMTSDLGPGHPGYRGTLQPHCTTLAEVLGEAGYHTSMVGKWHLHNRQGVKPTDRGFAEFYGMLGGYNSCWEEKPFYSRWPEGRAVREYTSAVAGKPGSFYATDVFADYAIDFMGEARRAGRPYFLYLAFNAPHFPLHAPESDIVKYEAMYFEKGWDVIREERMARVKALGLVPRELRLPERSEVPAKSHAVPSPFAGKANPAWLTLPEERRRDLARRMAVYAAMVDRMDAAIGRVVADIRERGRMENTLIVFLSDNGACWEWDPYGFDGSSGPQNVLHSGDDLRRLGQPGDYMSYGSGWANAGNTPWRLYKHFSHEGGIRTPMIMHWPAGLKERGGMRRDAGHVIDLMPTLVAAAGAKYPDERLGVRVLPMEGRDLLPGGDAVRPGLLCFEHEGSRAVREGDWKLVSLRGDRWELYELGSDPNEMRDLAKSEPGRVRAMAAQWEAWAARCRVEYEGKRSGGVVVKDSPQVVGRPLVVRVTVAGAAGDGVILAQGGREHGYALHVAGGRVHFTVRRDGKAETVAAAREGEDFAVTARLGAGGAMELQVGSGPVVRGRAGGLIAVQPKDGLSVGEDAGSAVGDYAVPFPLKAKISGVSVKAGEE